MAAPGLFRWLAGFSGYVLSLAVVAAAPQLSSQPTLKPIPTSGTQSQQKKPPAEALPAGAIAHLGDSRLRHAATPMCVLFSADGKRVFSTGHDEILRVWDVDSGVAVNTLPLHQSSLTPLCMTTDGTKLVVACADGQLRLLNSDTLKEISTFSMRVDSDFALSADGSLLATNTTNGLIVSELNSDLPKLELPAGSPLAFRPDGKTIAVGDPTGKVTLYMLAGGKPVFTFDHGKPLNGLVFSPDGKLIATGGTSDGEVVKVWEIGNSKPVAEIKGASKPQLWIGNNKIVAASESAVGVYDLAEKRWERLAKGITGEWAVSPDGTKVAATGTSGFRIHIWDLITGKELHIENDTFPDTVLLVPTRDHQAIFILSENRAFLWPVSKTEAKRVGTLPGKALTAATGGNRLAVAVQDGVLIYDGFDPTKPLADNPTCTLTAFATSCKSVAISPNGKKVAYSGDGVRIVIADAVDGTTIRVLRTQTVGLGLAFTPDSENLAVIGRDGFLRLCAAHSTAKDEPEDLWKIRVQRGQRGAAAISPDGKLIAASSSTQILVVDAADGSIVFTESRNNFDDGPYHQLAFSHDSRLLLTGSAGSTGAVQVLEIATRSRVRRYVTEFGTINCLGVFSDGLRMASAGAESAITLWDLSFRKGNTPPQADELSAAWRDLDSINGEKGYPAIRVLVAGSTQGVKVIAKGLQEMLDSQKEIATWVKELGSEDFPTRETATKKLLAQGIRVLPAVTQAAAKAESPEARKRASEIIAKLTAYDVRVQGNGLGGDTLRLVRAVQVLEDVGGSEAKKLLGQIAALGGRSGADAKAAIERIEKR
ncbi:MAG TPA: WD40 repeat domain-containing protein [Gemmata sp.]|nr:WD40 repeat domain-containing protein [Gemmata sp.]